MTKIEGIKQRDAVTAEMIVKPQRYIFRCYADEHEYEAEEPLPKNGMFCPACRKRARGSDHARVIPLLRDITPQYAPTRAELDRAYLIKLVDQLSSELIAAQAVLHADRTLPNFGTLVRNLDKVRAATQIMLGVADDD